MIKSQRRVEVIYADARWLSRVGNFSIRSASLTRHLQVIANSLPNHEPVYIVNGATVEGHGIAESQLRKAQEGESKIVVAIWKA